MSKLTPEDILKLARLARLRLTDAEVTEYASELSKILQYVEQLDEVDITGLKPTNQVTGLENVTRPDQIKSYGYDPKDLRDNVPAMQEEQIKVKRMIT